MFKKISIVGLPGLFKDLVVTLFLVFGFGFMFFYNLGGTSLIDFDEAWWAEVARNILVNRDPFVLTFNGGPIFFHPPFGYSLIALSQLIFGVGEFASRFPSALFGLGSVILTYLIGKNLFNRIVGISGSLMLVSSVWFILRARSGNLDAIFVFMFLLTIYLFIKTAKSRLYLYLSAMSFVLLFMTKTFIGVSVLAPIAVFLIVNLKKMKITLVSLALATSVTIYVLIPWYVSNRMLYGSIFLSNLFENAVKPGKQFIPNIFEIQRSTTMQYLHFGVREWYYPAIIALFGSWIFIKRFPNVLVLYAWAIPLLGAFIINSKTEIWHLIPIYPALGLMIGFFLSSSFEFLFSLINKLKLHKNLKNRILLSGKSLIILATLILCAKQIYEFKDGIGLFDHRVTGLAYTAKAARGLAGKLYLDNDNFLPSAVFYSQKKVYHLQGETSPKNTLMGMINGEKVTLLILTEKYRLEGEGVESDKYKVLSEHLGHVLISVN
ncbi:hypothetical protein A2164_04380 [Candidatus Curtissbacteria bacterium RBG_13_35_7]|uniref:Glycosyltransferase RgtA/B/C/D-like domain-containing protein n=1 Tax=Candidatus Curtissbacteria bacterium RBG_13_35_7 TaxID=1797705 RepID=A0A1F5G5H1_9BACT|nr:MAG: hypothetical protein A2164_04380 [Candidatus Curtissbacteria bacterium RBG_13_35_7]